MNLEETLNKSIQELEISHDNSNIFENLKKFDLSEKRNDKNNLFYIFFQFKHLWQPAMLSCYRCISMFDSWIKDKENINLLCVMTQHLQSIDDADLRIGLSIHFWEKDLSKTTLDILDSLSIKNDKFFYKYNLMDWVRPYLGQMQKILGVNTILIL